MEMLNITNKLSVYVNFKPIHETGRNSVLFPHNGKAFGFVFKGISVLFMNNSQKKNVGEKYKVREFSSEILKIRSSQLGNLWRGAFRNVKMNPLYWLLYG